ncbi:MAG: MoaD/ThiS family protein [Gammaproteobacteria bacterium]|nr:MoaD/ThiS family protein [Gammaproteobacteria bacterium]
MKIRFKLYASLTGYLPAGAEGHVADLDVDQPISPVQLLEQYNVPLADVHLVLINGVFVPPSERQKPLIEGDELAVWPAVAGG